MDSGHNFLWAHRMEGDLQNIRTDFLINALYLKSWHFEVLPYVCIGKPYICNGFYHPRREWAWPRAHRNVTTFTRIAQSCNIGCLHALYGSNMHVDTLYSRHNASCTMW